jgi:hypothetical protein
LSGVIIPTSKGKNKLMRLPVASFLTGGVLSDGDASEKSSAFGEIRFPQIKKQRQRAREPDGAESHQADPRIFN